MPSGQQNYAVRGDAADERAHFRGEGIFGRTYFDWAIRMKKRKTSDAYVKWIAEEILRGNLKPALHEILFRHAMWLHSGGRHGEELDLSPEGIRSIVTSWTA